MDGGGAHSSSQSPNLDLLSALFRTSLCTDGLRVYNLKWSVQLPENFPSLRDPFSDAPPPFPMPRELVLPPGTSLSCLFSLFFFFCLFPNATAELAIRNFPDRDFSGGMHHGPLLSSFDMTARAIPFSAETAQAPLLPPLSFRGGPNELRCVF